MAVGIVAAATGVEEQVLGRVASAVSSVWTVIPH
jgi:hypothetical protein